MLLVKRRRGGSKGGAPKRRGKATLPRLCKARFTSAVRRLMKIERSRAGKGGPRLWMSPFESRAKRQKSKKPRQTRLTQPRCCRIKNSVCASYLEKYRRSISRHGNTLLGHPSDFNGRTEHPGGLSSFLPAFFRLTRKIRSGVTRVLSARRLKTKEEREKQVEILDDFCTVGISSLLNLILNFSETVQSASSRR